MHQLYTAQSSEQAALRFLCTLWGEEFWPFEEIELSLRIPGTFLLYRSTDAAWSGLSLGRVSGDRAELYFIFVIPDSRGQRVGRALMQDFLEYARIQLGVTEVFLEVRPSNRAACQLYLSSGFSETGRRKRYYKDGEDALVYTCKLLP